MASQEAIKKLGTNGGGFFNANSAHPFENPTPFSNLLQMLLIFCIRAGLTYTFGKMVGDTRQGWAIFAAMCVHVPDRRVRLLLGRAGGQSDPGQARRGDGATRQRSPAATWKARRSGSAIAHAALFATVTTDASCGAVNSMHDSFTPLGGLVPLFNMQTGEVIFGGVGAGLYGMLLYAILAVFIAGLMVGRTPEYLGKKIEQKEVKMAMLALHRHRRLAFWYSRRSAPSSTFAEGRLLERILRRRRPAI